MEETSLEVPVVKVVRIFAMEGIIAHEILGKEDRPTIFHHVTLSIFFCQESLITLRARNGKLYNN
ncbi:hypothetical protein YC2023_039872 [Brassica napus]